MFMGQAFLVDTQQTGPRGGDKFYSPNWGMFAASHDAGSGSFMFQFMLSLDPATITEPPLFPSCSRPAKPPTASRWSTPSIRTISSWAWESTTRTRYQRTPRCSSTSRLWAIQRSVR